MIISDKELKGVVADLAALFAGPPQLENRFRAYWRDMERDCRTAPRTRELNADGLEVARLASDLTGADYERCVEIVEEHAINEWRWSVLDELRRLAELARGERKAKSVVENLPQPIDADADEVDRHHSPPRQAPPDVSRVKQQRGR